LSDGSCQIVASGTDYLIVSTWEGVISKKLMINVALCLYLKSVLMLNNVNTNDVTKKAAYV